MFYNSAWFKLSTQSPLKYIQNVHTWQYTYIKWAKISGFCMLRKVSVKAIPTRENLSYVIREQFVTLPWHPGRLKGIMLFFFHKFILLKPRLQFSFFLICVWPLLFYFNQNRNQWCAYKNYYSWFNWYWQVLLLKAQGLVLTCQCSQTQTLT